MQKVIGDKVLLVSSYMEIFQINDVKLLIFPGQAYPLDSQLLVVLVYLGVF